MCFTFMTNSIDDFFFSFFRLKSTKIWQQHLDIIVYASLVLLVVFQTQLLGFLVLLPYFLFLLVLR